MGHIITLEMETLANTMRLHADKSYFDGQNYDTLYFRLSRRIHQATGTLLLFTRDVGYHSCGWFKNPDYERCYHLSISFWDLKIEKPRPFEPKLAKIWAKVFYGDWEGFIWEEGPHRPFESTPHHYRVMCDPAWQPIIPRGEVYSNEFTEQGWKSWSEQQSDGR